MNSVIFENYETFINENKHDFNSPNDVVRLFNDDGMFTAYMESLTDRIDPDSKVGVINMLNRQREMILGESANVNASSFARGWVVSSFPILTDIYAEPLISQLCNVYPVTAPTITIPKMGLRAITKSFDGLTETIVDNMPNAFQQVQAAELVLTTTPGTSTNAFTALGLNPDIMKMNRRYTLLTNIIITETPSGGGSHEHKLELLYRPDNRNQISQELSFEDSTGTDITIRITGNVDYAKGTIIINILLDEISTSSFTADSAEFKLRFLPTGTKNGRTKVVIYNNGIDLTIDPNADFYIELDQEDIQDFQSIYKVDLLQTMSSGIKRQMLLNKDYDISYFLAAAEPEIDKFGAKRVVDMDQFRTTAETYNPATVIDVFKGIIPYISQLMGVIKKNYGMYPKYLVAGLQTAALLRSLQDFAVTLSSREGAIGFSGETANFSKLKVLESLSMNDNKMYLSTKANPNSLEHASIVDLVYQPMYIIKETTMGQSLNFVRSRTMSEIVRADGLGCIELQNIDRYM